MIIGIEADHANKINKSGVENVCYYLIENLKKVIPSEYQVVLYSRSPLVGNLGVLPKNWTNKILPWKLKKGWSQFRLSWELFFNPPDVFFAPGQLLPLFFKTKSVVLVHDSAFLFVPEAYGFLSKCYLKFMNKVIVRLADKILVTTEFNKKELLKKYPIQSEKIFITHLSYDKSIFYPKTEAEHEKIKNNYSINGKYILFVGRLEEKKNTFLVIKTFDNIKKMGLIDSLVLVGNFGKGLTGKSAESAFNSSPYKEDIKIIKEHVDNYELSVLYSGAEVFLFPSKYEGFGLPVLESFASGCPVVISDSSALPEVASGASLVVKTNDLDDLTEKTLEIIKDSKLRELMINKGLKRVEDFSWEKTASEIWQILSKTLPNS